jgi:hypothetical protein
MPITTVTLLCPIVSSVMEQHPSVQLRVEAICRSEGAALVRLLKLPECVCLILSAFVGYGARRRLGRIAPKRYRSEGPRMSGLQVDAPYDFSY